MRNHPILLLLCLFVLASGTAQETAAEQQTAALVAQIEKEAVENSQLETLAHQLMDVIGPRLVGTPQMNKAHEWAVATFKEWGIPAENEQWGTWRGWERGICHIDLLEPRVVSLHGRQLAWSPSTPAKGITADLITLPEVADSLAFAR